MPFKWVLSFPPFLSLWHPFTHPSPHPSPHVCIGTTFISTSSVYFPLVPRLPIPCFSLYTYSCLYTAVGLPPHPPPLFMSPESCLDLILSFVGTRDIRLITTSLPCSKCFRVNDHGCRIIVTFQVQGTITMWLTLTQNLIKWTENSKVVEYITLPFALQRLVIPMKFLNYMWALNLLSHSTWSYYPVVPRYANAWSNKEVP